MACKTETGRAGGGAERKGNNRRHSLPSGARAAVFADHVGIDSDTLRFSVSNSVVRSMGATWPYPQHGRDPNPYARAPAIPDLNVADGFDVLASMLSARGHSDARIAKFPGGNSARVLGQAWA